MFNQKGDPYRLFIVYSISTRAFMTLVFTVNMVYFVTVVGLNPLQMVLVGTVLESAIFLFEVPTGVVADTISRRLSIIIGVFLIGLGFFVQAVFPVFILILFAQVLWGIGYTFTSGALQAWITDEIGEEQAAPAFLHATQLEQIGALIAIGLSVYLSAVGSLKTPMILGSVLFWVLGFYLILRMPETGFTSVPQTERSSWKSMGKTLKTGISMLKIRPVLLKILLIGFFYGFYSEGLDRLWVPHVLDRFNLPQQGQAVMVGWVGGLSAASMVVTFFTTGFLRKWLGKTIRTDQLKLSLTLLSALLISFILLFAGSKKVIFAFILLLLISVIRDMIYPLYISWVNRRLDSRARATVLSMSSLVDAVGQIGGGPLVGVIANQFSTQAGLIASAVMLSPVLILLVGKTNEVDEN
jgi:DHA3 family tetracycline resistance protein-like MFS transporter